MSRTNERSDIRGYTERLLAAISETNRPAAERFRRAKLAEGLRPSSVMLHVLMLNRLDQFLKGAPFATAAPEQLQDHLNDCSTKWGTATVWGHTTRLRHYYRWLNDGELPKPLFRALKRRSLRDVVERRPVTVQEFEALLGAANRLLWGRNALRVQAILWVLWDSGFRIGEALALNVDSAEFDDRGGALLRIPDVPGLKSGPRTIYVAECVPSIRGWLKAHPEPNNPKALLFPSPRRGKYREHVEAVLNRLTKSAGIRHLHPHLFRHTRATRAAESGWVEAEMRAYFGWSRNSEMPSKYIHLASSTMRDRVRQEAGLNSMGRAANGPQKPSAPELAPHVRAFLEHLARNFQSADDPATPRPHNEPGRPPD